jgi:hypothetical protein
MAGVNIGTARIVIIVLLVVGGIAVLANGFGGAVSAAGPDVGTSISVSESPSPSPDETTAPTTPRETPSPQIEGVLFQVFNGTNETGLAGEVQQLLEGDGYTAAADAGNAPSPPVAKTVVYFRGGPSGAQNRSNATLVADTYFDGARVARLDQDLADIVADSADVVIIVGVDYADAHANG